MNTENVCKALRQAADVFENELDVMEGTHAYAHRYGGTAGCNVFRFLLEDACALRGITTDELLAGEAK